MNTAEDVNRNDKIINKQDHNFQENVDISLLNCKFFVVTNSFISGKNFLYKNV